MNCWRPYLWYTLNIGTIVNVSPLNDSSSHMMLLGLTLTRDWVKGGLGLAHGLGTWFVVAHGIVPWYCMWLSLYKALGGSIVYRPGGERWLAHLARMADFGHVMKIFIDAGFPHMGFPRYIVCLYVVSCYNVYFSLIIMLMFLILT